MATLEQSALPESSTYVRIRPALTGESFYVQYLISSLQWLLYPRVSAFFTGQASGRARGTAPLYLAGCFHAARVSVGRLHRVARGNWHDPISKLKAHSMGCLQGTAYCGTGGGGAVTGVRPITSSHRSLTWRKILLPTPIGLRT